ncbi:MAG TPA: lytic transglycosylase domain-containing protein [Eubacteriales bacterium]|nr:lytic transglycosylase domain-containing protein [Eubacteriales bacterium]
MEKAEARAVRRGGKRKRNGMKTAVIVLAAVIALCCAAFGGYLIREHVLYERALENYPVAYTDLIQTYAGEYDLDPYLVQSIMRCESSNDPNAVSEAGAIGLMQIMPDTGTWIAHKLDLDDVYTQDMLYDPETNIRFACWYLNFLNGRFDGGVMKIVAAYNAGHGSVEDWLEDERFSSDGELTVIPFEQTARYYEKVMTAYENYTTLYPDLFTGGASASVEAD